MTDEQKRLLKVMETAAEDIDLEEFEELVNTEKRGLAWVKMNELKKTQPFIDFKKLAPEFNFDEWSHIEVKRENSLFMKATSSIWEQLIINNGGWITPQKVYYDNPTYLTRAKNHREELDQFILKLPLCHGLNVRYRFVVDELFPKYIDEKLKSKQEVKIVSLGSGSGDDVMQTMRKYGPEVSFVGYDIDPFAIEIGQQLAKEIGLENRVEFREESLRKCNSKDYDIAMLVGIICSLPDSVAKRVLKQIRHGLKDDGLLIVGAASDKVAYGDPLTRFLAEYCADFYLEHRDKERMKKIVSEAGYEVIETTEEPSRYNNFAIARPKS